MARITFVRHTAVDVEPGICYGRSDVPVRSSFPEEASRVRKNIEGTIMENGIVFDAVYRSPLSRCRLLAEACCYPEAIPDDRLLEMNFGEWEMQRYDDIKDPRLQEWFDDWLNVTPPGGESFHDQHLRVASFIKEMKESGKENILVFTHAGIMMNALLYLNIVPLERLFSSQPSYGDLLELTI